MASKYEKTQEVREAPEEEKQELEKRVQQGETVVEGGTGGKSLEAQINLTQGRSKGGQSTLEKSGEEALQDKGVDTSKGR